MNIENLVKGLQIIVEEVSEGKFTVMEVPTVKINANLKDLVEEGSFLLMVSITELLLVWTITNLLLSILVILK